MREPPSPETPKLFVPTLLEMESRAMPWRPQKHQTLRDGDLPQPGAEGGFPAELGETLKQRHHRVLEQVLRHRPVGDEASDQGESSRRGRRVDSRLSRLVPCARASEQFRGYFDFD